MLGEGSLGRYVGLEMSLRSVKQISCMLACMHVVCHP